MRMYDIIAKKRDGGTLNHEELSFAVNGTTVDLTLATQPRLALAALA